MKLWKVRVGEAEDETKDAEHEYKLKVCWFNLSYNIPLAYISWAYHQAWFHNIVKSEIDALTASLWIFSISGFIMNTVELYLLKKGQIHSIMIFPLLPASLFCYGVTRLFVLCFSSCKTKQDEAYAEEDFTVKNVNSIDEY
jgi:hypothetical protein